MQLEQEMVSFQASDLWMKALMGGIINPMGERGNWPKKVLDLSEEWVHDFGKGCSKKPKTFTITRDRLNIYFKLAIISMALIEDQGKFKILAALTMPWQKIFCPDDMAPDIEKETAIVTEKFIDNEDDNFWDLGGFGGRLRLN